MNRRILQPTVLTIAGAAWTVAAIAGTAGFIIGRYPLLHQFIPVHFSNQGIPDRWQVTSYVLVLMPVWVQLILAAVFGAIAGLLLYRAKPGEQRQEGEPARQYRGRMLVAAESISLLAAIWVSFQGIAAARIMLLWQRGWGGLGMMYGQSLVVALVLSIVVGIRAGACLRRSRPAAPALDKNWSFRGIYFNPDDPALFVPLESGMGWTLNFSRPGAIFLMALFLIFGVGGPLIIMQLLLGE
jgi:uncharacterized membrane protein